MTKAYAKEILNLWKNDSRLFNGSMTEGQFESMLMSAGIRQADAIVILMALVLAGAKFAKN